MKDCLKELVKVIDVGFVGGSDANKIREQLDEETIAMSHYFFSENGLVARKGPELIGSEVQFPRQRPSKTIWVRKNSKSWLIFASTTSQISTSLSSGVPSWSIERDW